MAHEFIKSEVDESISGMDATRVFQLLGSIFFYGDFVAETPNERELKALMEKNGYFFKTEDELIEKLDR